MPPQAAKFFIYANICWTKTLFRGFRVTKKGVYNAAVGGKNFHFCKHLLDQNVVQGILRKGGSTNRNLSSFAENAEGVNPPHSVYRICNLCYDFFKKCGAFLGKKIFRLPQMRKILPKSKILSLPQMRKTKKKKRQQSDSNPRFQNYSPPLYPLLYPAFTGQCSQNCVYIYKLKKNFLVRKTIIK